MKHLNKLTLLTIVLAIVSNTAFAQMDNDLPPNAVPGKCYAKCLIPDEYETKTEEILVKEAASRLEIVPAVYGTESEEVMVKEGYTVLEVVPPTYTTVTEELLVKETSTRLEYVPPVYETQTEQILVAPASTKWVKSKRANSQCLSANPDDCKVWCLQEIPAQYRTITKEVLVTPASTREIPIPAEYKTVTKTVVQTPAQVVENQVAAEYRTITRQVVQTPATTQSIEIPAEYKTVTSRVLVRPAGFSEWREVLCEAKLTTATIIEIQRALQAAGFNPGPIDNVLGSQTRAAILEYQKANGLAVGLNGNQVPIETLNALGVR